MKFQLSISLVMRTFKLYHCKPHSLLTDLFLREEKRQREGGNANMSSKENEAQDVDLSSHKLQIISSGKPIVDRLNL